MLEEDANLGVRRFAAGAGRRQGRRGQRSEVLIDPSGSADLLVVACLGYGGLPACCWVGESAGGGAPAMQHVVVARWGSCLDLGCRVRRRGRASGSD